MNHKILAYQEWLNHHNLEAKRSNEVCKECEGEEKIYECGEINCECPNCSASECKACSGSGFKTENSKLEYEEIRRFWNRKWEHSTFIPK